MRVQMYGAHRANPSLNRRGSPVSLQHERRLAVERDLRTCSETPALRSAIAKMGGQCIVDFAWLGPGHVLVVELNPFDAVCLGSFPASTGLFDLDKPGEPIGPGNY